MVANNLQTPVSKEIGRMIVIGQIDKKRWAINGSPNSPMYEMDNLKLFRIGETESLMVLFNKVTNEVEGAKYYDTYISTEPIATFRKPF